VHLLSKTDGYWIFHFSQTLTEAYCRHCLLSYQSAFSFDSRSTRSSLPSWAEGRMLTHNYRVSKISFALPGSRRLFSGSEIWPKYNAGLGKTQDILTGNVFTFGGAKRSDSDREYKYFNFLLFVWTHVSLYCVNGLYFCKVYKVLAVVLYSSELSNFQLLFFISYFIYLLIDILPFAPRGCATALVGKYVPKFELADFSF